MGQETERAWCGGDSGTAESRMAPICPGPSPSHQQFEGLGPPDEGSNVSFRSSLERQLFQQAGRHLLQEGPGAPGSFADRLSPLPHLVPLLSQSSLSSHLWLCTDRSVLGASPRRQRFKFTGMTASWGMSDPLRETGIPADIASYQLQGCLAGWLLLVAILRLGYFRSLNPRASSPFQRPNQNRVSLQAQTRL